MCKWSDGSAVRDTRATQTMISDHSCPKQSLSSGFPQSNPLICSGVGSHQKTRSTTACAYPVQDTDRRGDGGRGTEGAQTWRCTGFPWLSTRAEVAPTGHSLSKTRLAKSCFGQDCSEDFPRKYGSPKRRAPLCRFAAPMVERGLRAHRRILSYLPHTSQSLQTAVHRGPKPFLSTTRSRYRVPARVNVFETPRSIIY